MIRHIVLVRFRPELQETEIASLLAPLGAIAARMGFQAAWGRSESPEKIERGYLHGFTADFADWAALAAYQDDPGRKAFGAGLVAHAQGGIDGILVFDLAIPGR
jgi:hypothetical protein